MSLRAGRPHVRLNSSSVDLVSRSPSRSREAPHHQRPNPINPPRPAQISQSAISSRHTSQEHLLPPPPRRNKTPTVVEISPGGESSPKGTDSPSSASSRRSSVDSATVFMQSTNPPTNPFRKKITTQTVAEKFSITPSAELLVWPGDVEKDDWLHTPVPGEKEPRDCDICNSRGINNMLGLGLLTIGILALFVIWPVVTFTRNEIFPDAVACGDNPDCIRDDYPLLKNLKLTLIDPDTPESLRTRTARDGSRMKLVFSDEFNKPGRTFYDEDDPYFQAVDIWYGATQDLEWYDPDNAITGGGVLNLRFDNEPTHGLDYRSAMLQSWNKLCFTGGYLEASMSLPGSGQTSGFWPGFWAMGNLGRPGYLATTEGMWPYSYHDECDYGITPNQSSADGLSWLPGMRMPACSCPNADHPSPGKSRSAPEIDAIEATVWFLKPPDQNGIGAASQSFQLAPFDIFYQPNYDFVELYDQKVTMMNTYRGGPYQQAFSAITSLSNEHYDGNGYQTYAFEYAPGADGYAKFFVGEEPTWTLEGASIGPNGNIGQRVLPMEPLSVVSNFGISPTFAAINLTGLLQEFPATMRVDYIRIYQKEGEESVTCDPPGYPTTDFIAKHPAAYKNREAITWEGAGYEWPKNSFVHGCD